MDSLLNFACLAFYAAAIGFGARLGWEIFPEVGKIVNYILAVPLWLVQLAMFRWRNRSH